MARLENVTIFDLGQHTLKLSVQLLARGKPQIYRILNDSESFLFRRAIAYGRRYCLTIMDCKTQFQYLRTHHQAGGIGTNRRRAYPC